jgi:hypothetical protein
MMGLVGMLVMGGMMGKIGVGRVGRRTGGAGCGSTVGGVMDGRDNWLVFKF